MKYYKDDCHHYKVIDKLRAITVTNLSKFESSICYDAYLLREHHIIEYVKDKRVTPCTKEDFDTAFHEVLKTINNLKN